MTPSDCSSPPSAAPTLFAGRCSTRSRTNVYLYGPKLAAIDLGLNKTFRLGGARTFNLEALLINAFNHRSVTVGNAKKTVELFLGVLVSSSLRASSRRAVALAGSPPPHWIAQQAAARGKLLHP